MSHITRLRRISWKSKNNVYWLALAYKQSSVTLEEYVKSNFDALKLDVLILPIHLNIDLSQITGHFPEIEIIRVWIKGKDNIQNWLSVDESIANELAQDILRIDSIQVWLYSWASAKVALDRGERYEWKNIGILLY